MKKNSTVLYKRDATVIFHEEGGQVFILDDKNDQVITLNETSSQLWHLLGSDQSIESLEIAMHEDFSKIPKDVIEDVRLFIKEMTKLGLVEVVR